MTESDRAFRYSRQKAAMASKVKGEMAEYQIKEATRAAEVEALERLQAQRPLAPPGRIKLKGPTPSPMPAGGSPLLDQQPGTSGRRL